MAPEVESTIMYCKTLFSLQENPESTLQHLKQNKFLIKDAQKYKVLPLVIDT